MGNTGLHILCSISVFLETLINKLIREYPRQIFEPLHLCSLSLIYRDRYIKARNSIHSSYLVHTAV